MQPVFSRCLATGHGSVQRQCDWSCSRLSGEIRGLLRQQVFQVIHFRSPFEGGVVCDRALNSGAKLVYEVNGFPTVEMPYHYSGIEHSQFLEKLGRMEVVLSSGGGSDYRCFPNQRAFHSATFRRDPNRSCHPQRSGF